MSTSKNIELMNSQELKDRIRLLEKSLRGSLREIQLLEEHIKFIMLTADVSKS